MKISPISNLNNSNSNVRMRGKVSRETTGLITEMADGWISKASEKQLNNDALRQSYITSITRIENVLENLNTLMLRFGHDCRLSHAKSSKTDKYRFFVEHKNSNYKKPITDIVFSENRNAVEDIEELEKLEDSLYKVDPYMENNNFIIQRTDTGVISDIRFAPDKDIIFIEDELIERIK